MFLSSRHRHRTARISALTVMLLAMVFTPMAMAEAPTLSSPASDASFTAGAEVPFAWSGTLQGDEDATSRAYFKIEIALSKDVPSGTNTVWADDIIEASALTTPGEAEASMTLGAPDAGDYKWRVCAWGVVDDQVSNVIEMIDCSGSRAISTTAVGTDTLSTETVTITNEIRTSTPTRTIAPAPAPAPAPEPVAQPEPEPAPVPVAPAEPTASFGFDPNAVSLDEGESVVGLDLGDLGLGDGGLLGLGLLGGLAGSLLNSLSSTIPGTPIPLWAVLIPMLAIPTVLLWRRYAGGMYDLDSADGAGKSPDGGDGESLAAVPVKADAPAADQSPDERAA